MSNEAWCERSLGAPGLQETGLSSMTVKQWCHCGTDLLTFCFFFKFDCLNGVFVGS